LIAERQDGTRAAGSGRRGSVLLLALSFASFLAQTSLIGMTPFLLDMAQDQPTALAMLVLVPRPARRGIRPRITIAVRVSYSATRA
jgi:hypothetical protein